MSAVVAVTADLILLSRIRAAADHLRLDVKVPQRALDVTEMLLHDETRAVLVDLHHPRIDGIEAIRLVRGTRWDTRLVAFGDHVDAARLARARDAGCPTVVPNSEFVKRLPEFLA